MNPYLGLLGMSEMETALERIVSLAERAGKFRDFSCFFVQWSNFETEQERIGFLNLLAYGWYGPAFPNSYFAPTEGLITRMRTREVWKDLVCKPWSDSICLT